MRSTAWGTYPSTTPHLIQSIRDEDDWLQLRLGDGTWCKVHPKTGELRIKSSVSTPMQGMDSRQLVLHPWGQRSVPQLLLHPFALLHLLVNEQERPFRTLLVQLAATAKDTPQLSLQTYITVTEPCQLLKMLDVPLLYLTFATTYTQELRPLAWA